MRALVLVLLLANLLFLAWAAWIDAPVPGGNGPGNLPKLEVLGAGAPAAAAAPVADAATRCAALGPLPDESATGALQAALNERRLTGSVRHVVDQELEGYWVHIDDQANEVSRRRALQRLERAGVHGAEIIAATGQVSVGLFADQPAADRRIAAVKAAGYKASSEPRKRLVTRHYLDVLMPVDAPLPPVDALVAGLNLPEPPQWGNCPAPKAGG